MSVPLTVAIPETGTVRKIFELTALSRLVSTTIGLPAGRDAAMTPRTACPTAGRHIARPERRSQPEPRTRPRHPVRPDDRETREAVIRSMPLPGQR